MALPLSSVQIHLKIASRLLTDLDAQSAVGLALTHECTGMVKANSIMNEHPLGKGFVQTISARQPDLRSPSRVIPMACPLVQQATAAGRTGFGRVCLNDWPTLGSPFGDVPTLMLTVFNNPLVTKRGGS